jgi:DNA-binding CsgD family transcriptional regulator
MFAQVIGAYLLNIRIHSLEWIEELQEISLVLIAPLTALFANAACRVKQRRFRDIGVLIFGLLSIGFYLYGNYIDAGMWEYLFTLNIALLFISVTYACLTMIIRKGSAGGISRGLRLAACISTLTLFLLAGVMEWGFRFRLFPASLLYLQPGIPPFICLIWASTFLYSDLSRMFRKATRPKAFDMGTIRDHFELSTRECEVTDLLLQGKRYEEIGKALFISKATVKTYIYRVYQKAGVGSKMQLVNKLLSLNPE